MSFPIIPLIIAGLGLAACAGYAQQTKPDRPLYDLSDSEWGPANNNTQFVRFEGNGGIVGHGGCNNFFGNYDLNGTMLRVGPLASTKMACPNLPSEAAFLNALQNARRIEATHLRLTLFDESGRPILSLQRKDWD